MHALNAVNSTSIHELQTDTKMLPMEIGMLPGKTAMLPGKTAMLPVKTGMLPGKTATLPVYAGMAGAMRQCCPGSLPFNCGEICKKENTYTPPYKDYTQYLPTHLTLFTYIFDILTIIYVGFESFTLHRSATRTYMEVNLS